MDINKKIQTYINLYSAPYKVDLTTKAYNNLKKETIILLKKRKIKIAINNTIPEIRVYGHKSDCFAFENNDCLALIKINCEDCKFYNNKIKMQDIEESIRQYTKKKYDERYNIK